MKTGSALRLAAFCVAAMAATFCITPGSRSAAQAPDRELARAANAIIETNCRGCHGEQKRGGLDLRNRETALQGGARGPAIIPGKGADSLLYKMVSGTFSPRMPMGGELPAPQIATLKTWIDAGAPWPETSAPPATEATRAVFREKELTAEQRNYPAFRRPVAAPIPALARPEHRAWARNPIDHFILAELAGKGLDPAPAAGKRTLLRRVTLDLTGLPPTPAEIHAFIADNSPAAWEKVVDRLLASPQYGERQAQHWLDVVRFGETNGYELDADREQAWRYRDYVVNAFNQDKPYDRFILEQIAGDELAPASFEAHVATGFLRAGPQHVVAGNLDQKELRQEYLTEIMLGVGSGVMGLTVGCARCHDHKFDPILQADFYRLQAFFAAADNSDFTNYTKAEKEAHEAALKAHKEKLKPIQDQLKEIEKPYESRIENEKRALLEPRYRAALDIPKDKRTKEQAEEAKLAERMIDVKYEELLAILPADVRERRAALRRKMHALDFEAPVPLPKAPAVTDKLAPMPVMQVLKGGDVHAPLREAPPRFPTVLLPPDARASADITPVRYRDAEGAEKTSSGRRLALARWLTSPENPLTARVMVNRLWRQHFGHGIVRTPNDFGRNGAQPTHPALLDWLAVAFMEKDEGGRMKDEPSPPLHPSAPWSIKRMHKLMVMSATYR
ncbi:MAG: PSD1 and planctomycete cytochrome C domain-containing protein, partial [Blastocatellia bacterium]